MTGTIIDTTSLIALAINNPDEESWLRSRIMSDTFNDSNVLSGIEALLISDIIFVDFPSYERNLNTFPELKKFSGIVEFINTDEKDEDLCYESCADVIVPLMNRPDDFLVDVLRRHIIDIDYCELSVNKYRFAPSTYWRDLSGRLSHGENCIVKALEGKFGSHTPFSGAALTNLIRFLYYTACQDEHSCNLSIHFVKSSFLNEISRSRFLGGEKTAKTLIDVFDKEVTDTYRKNYEKWIGQDNKEIALPLLLRFVKRNRKKGNTLIDDLLRIRNFKVCEEFRDGIKSFQEAIDRKNGTVVKEFLNAIENFTAAVASGHEENPNQVLHKITVTIPFVGGLGTEVNIKTPKLKKTPKDKILTFLHQAIL